MDTKINLVFALPKSIKYYSYYLNNNLQDRHLMKRDDFYFFLAALTTDNHLPSQIREFIDKNRIFLLNTKTNKIQELQPDSVNNQKNFEEKKFQYSIKKYFQKQKKEEKEKNPFNQEEIKKMHKKMGVK